MNIIGSFILLITFLITLISTFSFLQNKNLNLIPLVSLFIVSLSVIILVVNSIRYKVLNKLKVGEFIVDEDFLKLYILKKYFEKENILKKDEKSKMGDNEDKTVKKEISQYSDFIEDSDISKYTTKDNLFNTLVDKDCKKHKE